MPCYGWRLDQAGSTNDKLRTPSEPLHVCIQDSIAIMHEMCGERIFEKLEIKKCSPGLVFAGGMDGILRALDANSGDVLWRYDTRRSYQSINGIEGIGGSIEADGPVIANGELFITSGYDKWAEIPGNVLLVFALPNQSIQQKSK